MVQKIECRSIAGRRATRAVLLAMFAIAAAVPELRAESLASKVREGNRLFADGKYADAENAYLDAQVRNPGRPEVVYNLGNSLIRQKKYDQGIRSLAQSAARGNKVLRRDSWYNTGNAFFEAGGFKDSIEAYVQALRLDPYDKDAKHNLELALLKLRKQQQSAANQKPDNSGSPKQDKKDASQSEKNAAQRPDQHQNETGGGTEQKNAARKQESPDAQRPGSISREQAAQILDAVRAQELEQQRKLVEALARRKANGKDW